MFSQERHFPKWLKAVQKNETKQGLAQSVALVRGREPFAWTPGAIAWLVGFATAFVVGLYFGRVFIPGGVVLVLAYNSAKPLRFVTVGPLGFRIWGASLLNGGPKKLIDTQPLEHLGRLDMKTSTFGPRLIELKPEHHELVRSTAAHQLHPAVSSQVVASAG